MKIIALTALVILCIRIDALSQNTFHGGLKFGYYFSNSFYVDELIDGISIRSTKAGLDGFEMAFFTDYQITKRFIFSGEASYSWNIGTSGPIIQLLNATMVKDSLYWLTSISPSFNTIQINAKLRFKLNTYIEPFIGVGVVRIVNYERSEFQYLDETEYDAESQDEVRRINYQNELVASIENSYENYALINSLGLRVRYKRLILDISYEQTLTPVSKELIFQGNKYAFFQHMDRLSVLLGYRLF